MFVRWNGKIEIKSWRLHYEDHIAIDFNQFASKHMYFIMLPLC